MGHSNLTIARICAALTFLVALSACDTSGGGEGSRLMLTEAHPESKQMARIAARTVIENCLNASARQLAANSSGGPQVHVLSGAKAFDVIAEANRMIYASAATAKFIGGGVKSGDYEVRCSSGNYLHYVDSRTFAAELAAVLPALPAGVEALDIDVSTSSQFSRRFMFRPLPGPASNDFRKAGLMVSANVGGPIALYSGEDIPIATKFELFMLIPAEYTDRPMVEVQRQMMQRLDPEDVAGLNERIASEQAERLGQRRRYIEDVRQGEREEERQAAEGRAKVKAFEDASSRRGAAIMGAAVTGAFQGLEQQQEQFDAIDRQLGTTPQARAERRLENAASQPGSTGNLSLTSDCARVLNPPASHPQLPPVRHPTCDDAGLRAAEATMRSQMQEYDRGVAIRAESAGALEARKAAMESEKASALARQEAICRAHVADGGNICSSLCPSTMTKGCAAIEKH